MYAFIFQSTENSQVVVVDAPSDDVSCERNWPAWHTQYTVVKKTVHMKSHSKMAAQLDSKY